LDWFFPDFREGGSEQIREGALDDDVLSGMFLFITSVPFERIKFELPSPQGAARGYKRNDI